MYHFNIKGDFRATPINGFLLACQYESDHENVFRCFIGEHLDMDFVAFQYDYVDGVARCEIVLSGGDRTIIDDHDYVIILSRQRILAVRVDEYEKLFNSEPNAIIC